MPQTFTIYDHDRNEGDHGRPLPQRRYYMSYDGKWTHKGIEPVSPDELRRLDLEPHGASVEDQAAWNVDQKKRVTAVWLAAQATFYGLSERAIQFSKEELMHRCRNRLQEMDQAGEALDPTSYQRGTWPVGAETVEGLKQYWEERCAAFEKTLDSRPNYDAFMKLENLEDKLRLDADLFMDIYFLDRNKTPETLVFDNTDLSRVKSAVDKVKYLHAKMVGRGKNKKLRIGWSLYDVLYPEDEHSVNGNGSSPPPPRPAVQAHITKAKNRVARMLPHTRYLSSSQSARKCHLGPLSGSYHMEITGPGWNDKIYKPNGGNMWLDIRSPTITSGVYEATFDFGPAMRGMMLISADKAQLKVHSRIMDTMDWEYHDDDFIDTGVLEGINYGPPFVKHDPRRQAFLDGFVYAMKRKRAHDDEHEEAFARHKRPLNSDREDEKPQPTKYWVLCRGIRKIPEWSEDIVDEHVGETCAMMTFGDDGKLNDFTLEMSCVPTFKGVPQLSAATSVIQGYRVASYPKHRPAVPGRSRIDEDEYYDRFLDETRGDILAPKKRKTEQMADWGALREWSWQKHTFYIPTDYQIGGERESPERKFKCSVELEMGWDR